MKPSLSDFSERAWEDSTQDFVIDILEHHLGSKRRNVSDWISHTIVLV